MPTAGDIYYTTSNLGKAGSTPLVLIHGAGGSQMGWHLHLRRLPGVNVIALDLPGHGKSSGEGKQSIRDYARTISQFLLQANIFQCVLVGHSLGGMIALQTTIDYPDQVLGTMILSASAECPIPVEIIQGLLNPLLYSTSIDWLVERLSGGSAGARWVEATRKAVSQTRTGVLYGDLTACHKANLNKHLPDINNPVWICSGENDRFFPPRAARTMAGRIGNAQYFGILGAGHLLPLEKPDEIAGLLYKFLFELTGERFC